MTTRLLRHDQLIVANELRFALSSWSDRLLAFAALFIALVAVRSALSDRSFMFAATAIAGIAVAVGATVARIIERRLDFHSQDGVLAVEALAGDARWRYALPIHVLACIIVTLCALITRPNAAVLAPIGYLIGAVVSHMVCRGVLTDAAPRRSFNLRAFRSQLRRPISGAVAAIAVVLPLLLLRSIAAQSLATLIGLVSGVVALLFTMVDYSVIRFMTESGHSAVRIIGIHARSLLIFVVLTVPASLVLSDALVAIVAFGVVLAALIFMTSRVLAYRIYPKRTADTLVSICSIVCVAGVAMPMFLPVVVIAILWQLYRRAVPATWLLK